MRAALAVAVTAAIAVAIAGSVRESAPADEIGRSQTPEERAKHLARGRAMFLSARGRTLFADPSLSAGGAHACATCHPDKGHTDNKTYVGLAVVDDGDPRGRNTPSLWGAGSRAAFLWAGTAPSLAASIREIIVERMGGAEPSGETVEALAVYVASLRYPRNPLLARDGTPTDEAPAAARRGFALFMGKAGCHTCHVPPAYDRKEPADVGSGGTFKVPSLRVASLTAPYYHDGRYATLDKAVRAMATYARKAGLAAGDLTADEIRDLVAFLRVL